MPKSKPTASPRKLIPAGLLWRDGRPRWVPSPGLRKAGWKGGDLRDERGQFLAEGPAFMQARAIVEAVAAWRAGGPVPVGLVAFAPEGSTGAGGKHVRRTIASERSIGALADAYLDDPMPGAEPLAPRTRVEYRMTLNVVIATIAELRGVSVEAIRAQDIALLKLPAEGSGHPFYLQLAYEHMRERRGVHMSRSCITTASSWFAWIKRKKRLLVGENPCLSVWTEKPEGRIVVFTDRELQALIAAAEWIGLPSIADAIVLGFDLSWAKQDLLALRWDQIDDEHRAIGRRIKTGVPVAPRLMPAGRKRLAEIRLRQVATWGTERQPEHVLACELPQRSGLSWNTHTFGSWFRIVRDIASAEVGVAIFDKRFADLRDSAITRFDELGLSDKEIATRSGHAIESVSRILAEHYAKRTKKLADSASDHLERKLQAEADKASDRLERMLAANG